MQNVVYCRFDHALLINLHVLYFMQLQSSGILIISWQWNSAQSVQPEMCPFCWEKSTLWPTRHTWLSPLLVCPPGTVCQICPPGTVCQICPQPEHHRICFWGLLARGASHSGVLMRHCTNIHTVIDPGDHFSGVSGNLEMSGNSA